MNAAKELKGFKKMRSDLDAHLLSHLYAVLRVQRALLAVTEKKRRRRKFRFLRAAHSAVTAMKARFDVFVEELLKRPLLSS